MGVFFSRLRKKKETTELLEELDVEIKGCINFRLENQESQRRWVGRLTLWGIVSYVIMAFFYYLIYFPVGWVQRIVYSAVLIVVPVILLMALRRFLTWFYSSRITKNEERLLLLKEEKEKILEEVMENETYKKAKEILEKFDPERHKTMTPPRLSAQSTPKAQGSELRQRKGVNQMATPKAPPPPSSAALAIGPPPPKPVTSASATACQNGVVLRAPVNTPARMGFNPGNATPAGGTPVRPLRMFPPALGPGSNFAHRGLATSMTRPPVLPRPVLQADRGVLDRLTEYLVGAGPSNRYALICRRCHRHNGMALKEEFEYLAFHCAYCQFLNPAKRKRPIAPRLPESNPPSGRESDAGSESDFNVSPPKRSDSIEELQQQRQPPSPSTSVANVGGGDAVKVVGSGVVDGAVTSSSASSSPTASARVSRSLSMTPMVEEGSDDDVVDVEEDDGDVDNQKNHNGVGDEDDSDGDGDSTSRSRSSSPVLALDSTENVASRAISGPTSGAERLNDSNERMDVEPPTN